MYPDHKYTGCKYEQNCAPKITSPQLSTSHCTGAILVLHEVFPAGCVKLFSESLMETDGSDESNRRMCFELLKCLEVTVQAQAFVKYSSVRILVCVCRAPSCGWKAVVLVWAGQGRTEGGRVSKKTGPWSIWWTEPNWVYKKAGPWPYSASALKYLESATFLIEIRCVFDGTHLLTVLAENDRWKSAQMEEICK